MKILHVIASTDPAHGGPPAVVMRMAAAQAGLGHDAHLLSYVAREAEARISQSNLNVPDADLVTQHRVATRGIGERLLCLVGRARLHHAMDGAAVVHIHGVWEPLLKCAAIIAARRGIPYCIRPAGMLDPWSLRQKRWKKALALRLGYRAMIDSAAFIQALNADEARLLRRLGPLSPTVVVPNGIFLDEIEPLPARGTFSNHVPGLEGKTFILFMARLHPKKGLDHLAQAFARVAAIRPDVDLVVAGPDGGAQAQFELAIASAGLAGRTHLVGPLYGSRKLAALRDAACFCLPSRQEGFSVAITEALACGVPVVISEECHFPEVRSAGAGEVVPLTAGALAEALLRVLSDPETARAMSEAGRDLVRTRFTWPRIAAQTIEAYRRVQL